MKKLLLLTALILIPIQAKTDAVCFADAEGVNRHSPGAWVSWTYQMKGHIGEKCYFPTTKNVKKWNPNVDKDSGVGSSKLPAAVLIPLPRPSPLYEINTELVFLTPSNLR